MIDISKIDYSHLDLPEILAILFYPRPEWGPGQSEGPSIDVLIPVEDSIAIGGRFHMTNKDGPSILFFHGNGEIVSDYDDFGPIFNNMGMNFMPVDYRGYGRSTGRPSITSMLRDCHFILEFAINWLRENNYSGPVILMGRSLGSASVLELASSYQDYISGLIVESGFARTDHLLRRLGMDPSEIGFSEERGLGNLEKIGAYYGPTLVIHAEQDHILPFHNGQELYDASGSKDKTFLSIPNANHNDIFIEGYKEYLGAVRTLVRKVASGSR